MILDLEQKLKETEEILQIIFENTPDIIMIIDDKGVILDINRIVPPLAKKDVIGKNSIDLIQTKYREIYKNALNDVFQKASRKYLEYTTLDGLSWLARIIPFKKNQSITKAMIISTNITKKKEFKTDLIKEKAILDAALDSMKDTFFVYDPVHNKPIRWNKAFEEISGYTTEEICALKSMDGMYDESDLEKAYNSLKKLIQTGRAISQLNFINKYGKIIPFEYSSSLIRNIEKNTNYVVSIGRDLTERIKEEQNFKRFLTTITHELRTPITVISTSYNLLKKHQDTLEDEEKNKLEENITKNINLLEQLSHEFLTILQLEAKEWKINWTEYNLSNILKNIVFLHKKSIKNKEFSYNLNFNDDLMLFGDPQRIEQIFHIIIDNAIKYSKENVSLNIEAIENYKGKYNPENLEGVLLIFNDNGLGIPEIDLTHIFERFYRSKEIINIPGTGLGLSIANEIIKKHKGEIFVESEHGKGSSFFIFLPYLT